MPEQQSRSFWPTTVREWLGFVSACAVLSGGLVGLTVKAYGLDTVQARDTAISVVDRRVAALESIHRTDMQRVENSLRRIEAAVQCLLYELPGERCEGAMR